VDFLRISGEPRAMNSGPLTGLDIAKQRDQGRRIFAVEPAARMKAQRLADVVRQRIDIDSARLSEVALGRGAVNRFGLVPKLKGAGEIARILVPVDWRGAGRRLERCLPVDSELIDLVEMPVRAAGETMIVRIIHGGIDVQAWRVIVVKRAENLAAGRG